MTLWAPRSAPASGLDGNGPIGAAPVGMSYGPFELALDASFGRSSDVLFSILGPSINLRCEHVVLPPADNCRVVQRPRRRIA